MKRSARQVEDELLVLRCQDGDADAMEELVSRWQSRILKHAWRLIGHSEGARDIAQESWLSIFRGLRSLHDPTYFQPWAYRIVTRKCADFIRENQRRREVAEDAVRELASEESEAPDVRSLIRRLPGSSRAALSMYYVDELSVAEIAEALGLAEGTIKSRLHTARQRLRAAFEARDREGK